MKLDLRLHVLLQDTPFQYEVSYSIGNSNTRSLIYHGVNYNARFRLPSGLQTDNYTGTSIHLFNKEFPLALAWKL